MQIIAQCPGCTSCWLLDEDAAGRRVRCKTCRTLFKVPALEQVPRAVKVIRQARGTVYVDQNGRTYG